MSHAFNTANAPLVCWSCHERTIGTHFCSSCGRMLQPSSESDYFATFGLPRKLWIEMSALEQKFLQLSWNLHPDNFVNSSESERQLSLHHTSHFNNPHQL